MRKIAEEETEHIKDGKDGDFIATKAEALARKMFNIALGADEVVINDEGDETTIHHAPDTKMMSLIFDRLEGRAKTADDDTSTKLTVSERVTEQGANRINASGGIENAGPDGPKT